MCFGFFSKLRPQRSNPIDTLCPYTTLFRSVKSGQLLLGPTGAGRLQPFPCIDCGLRLVEGPLALLRFQVNQEPLDHTVIHVMGPEDRKRTRLKSSHYCTIRMTTSG